MIPNSVIETILDQADIVDVIGQFVQLKQKGKNWIGKSPFNDEKTPSFSVSPAKQIFKCFSSDISGGVVKFLKVHKGMSFPEAITYLADKYGIEIPKEESYNEEEVDKTNTKEELFNLNEFAASYFRQALPSSPVALDYANKRVNADNQVEFNIGYAYNDYHKFHQAALAAGYSETLLLLSGLIHQNDKLVTYDFFRHRIIFPIHNTQGRICAFAGRVFETSKLKQSKYLNITNTPVFNKSFTLFGLFFAQDSIRKLDFSIIVEGYTDVISLHSADVYNAVAPCGTALSKDQIKMLSRYSKNAVLFYDGDPAGQKASIKNARICLENGLFPSIVELPFSQDPDSYIRENPKIKMPEFIIGNRLAFPLWLADKLFTGTQDDPVLRNEAIRDVALILSLYQEESLVTLFISKICKKFKIAQSLLSDKVSQFAIAARTTPVEAGVKLPSHVNPADFHKWGFYEDNNEYHFSTKDGIQQYSNFVMKPLYHVESTIDTRRIFELTNYAGHKVTIDFDMTEMTSIMNFKRIIEGKGNFLFWGTEYYLTKLKQKWYEETKTCAEIRNLGWQREGFWAWANGISTEEGFTELDSTGLIAFHDRNFFIPAFSNIYINDKSVFIDERKFIYLKKDVTIRKWAEMFIQVFGENAKFGIAFYISSLFRDHLLHLFSNFPILNLFGPKGTGKSQMAMSLSCLFGKQQTPFNIHNGTKAGLAEHIQQFINAFAWIDEYKNNIEYDKIETLKSIYDSIGRNRLNYDKGKKKETTLVNSAVILSGQEMPTADVALFSRVMFLQFHQTEYSIAEKESYTLLKDMEKQGLSHVTAEILKYRSFFVENYYENYDNALSILLKDLGETVVEDRILRNWCAMLASILTLEENLDLPFTFDDLKKSAIKSMVNQNAQIASSNEISIFWDLVESLFDNNTLIDKWHFVVAHAEHIQEKSRDIILPQPMTVIKIKFTSVYKIYSEHAKRSSMKFLPSATLKYYLENSKHFLGVENSTRFTRKDYVIAEGEPVETKQVTSSYVFDYHALNINMIRLLESAPNGPKSKPYGVSVSTDED
ncbi:MAG: DNA primase [Bacteroidales bacterium]|nr:DNA primase [Bacteroidales bacterium]